MERAENWKPSPAPNRDPLARGGFTDGSHEFWVYALSAESPDAFQVCADGSQTDIVLIVSGLNSGLVHATWGEGWRTRSREWREWAKDCAAHVFDNGSLLREHQPRVAAGKVRFCDG
jgi:hypothetical protein